MGSKSRNFVIEQMTEKPLALYYCSIRDNGQSSQIVDKDDLVIYVIPSPPLHGIQLLHRQDLPGREVSRMDLCVNFHPTVLRNQFIRNRYSFMNWNALLHNRIVLHITHTQ